MTLSVANSPAPYLRRRSATDSLVSNQTVRAAEEKELVKLQALVYDILPPSELHEEEGAGKRIPECEDYSIGSSSNNQTE